MPRLLYYCSSTFLIFKKCQSASSTQKATDEYLYIVFLLVLAYLCNTQAFRAGSQLAGQAGVQLWVLALVSVGRPTDLEVFVSGFLCVWVWVSGLEFMQCCEGTFLLVYEGGKHVCMRACSGLLTLQGVKSQSSLGRSKFFVPESILWPWATCTHFFLPEKALLIRSPEQSTDRMTQGTLPPDDSHHYYLFIFTVF